ncbi:metallophosphoesterase family protein [Methanobacterium congolense]|uniref:Calcineurin-like phosphoesterase domain-containing protein n=1 Tax=Methanobacterium congolense TaxID=118062 RepID=A0A1D3L349_9EURY|nr:metallophosphoesterase [Methanobacterium congolense]SCG86041.1 putative protein MJ1162 [Methanobacterium congolense]
MKILAVSDIHGKYHKILNYLKSNHVDLIIIAGDITNFGPSELGEEILNEISSFNIPVLAIPGNCDQTCIYNEIDNSNAVNIHGRNVVIKDVGICGFGGSNPTPFETPLEFEEIQIYEEAKKTLERIKDQKITLFVTHAPPKDTMADLLPSGDHVGSEAVRRIIEELQPTLNICGHIHEAKGEDKIGETCIINPGQLSEGNACLIDINDSEDVTHVRHEIVDI